MSDQETLARQWRALNEQSAYGRLAPSTLRGAWWAWRAVRRARRDLKSDGIATIQVLRPPRLSWGSRTGVNGVLRRTDPTCLERCLVQQVWLSSHGIRREVVIGVKREDVDVKAHAWIDGMTDPAEFDGYRVIHRISST